MNNIRMQLCMWYNTIHRNPITFVILWEIFASNCVGYLSNRKINSQKTTIYIGYGACCETIKPLKKKWIIGWDQFKPQMRLKRVRLTMPPKVSIFWYTFPIPNKNNNQKKDSGEFTRLSKFRIINSLVCVYLCNQRYAKLAQNENKNDATTNHIAKHLSSNEFARSHIRCGDWSNLAN